MNFRLNWKTGASAMLAAGMAAQAQIAPAGEAQIRELLTLKASMSAEQRKMDSALAWASMKAEGKLPPWLANITTDRGTGSVDIEIRGNVSDSLVQLINDVGGTVNSFSVGSRILQARVPAYEVERVSQSADVSQVSKRAEATTNSYSPGKVHPAIRMQDPLYQRWEARKLAQVKNRKWNRDLPLLASNGLIPGIFAWFADQSTRAAVGALTSQGYITHKANTVGYNGAGVKVGVLSDSASAARVAALIASGDLPSNTVVLPGESGGAQSDEGTAMMEIVYDMAPGSQIYFATAFTSVASFAANIIALKDAGCSIIVDDVSYFNEGVFQDGPIAQAVNTVTAAGVTYLSSAGNSGNKLQGTSGAWEGDFVDGGSISSGPIFNFEGDVVKIHNWGGSTSNNLTAVSSNILALKWSDPLGGASNDYDLLVLNAAGTAIKRFGAAFQSGTQDPVELTSGGSQNVAVGDQVVAVLYFGSGRALNFTANRGRVAINTNGVVYGHNAAANAVTVAAVFWNGARRGTVPFVAGSSYKTETFSSDGPRRIFYQPNGTPIGGGITFASGGGTLLQKPNLTAADGVSTKTPGFLPFYGTSAAAPSAAGIAAIVKQVRPGYTPAQVKAALYANALDIMTAGPDNTAGVGITMADKAVAYALANP